MTAPGATAARVAIRVADHRAQATLARAVTRAGSNLAGAWDREPPDVLVADWPPDADTRLLLDRAGSRPELVAVVPAADPAVAETAMDWGAGDCLLLPVRPAEAGVCLSAALRRARGRSSLADPATLVEALPTGLAVLSPDGRIAQVNRTLAELAGAPAAALLGLRIGQDRLLGPDSDRVVGLFRLARQAGFADGELTMRAPGGPQRPVNVRVAVTRDDTGTVSAYLLTVRPPTEHERTQAALGRIATSSSAETAAGIFHRLAAEAAELVGAAAVAVLRTETDGQLVVGATGAAIATGTRLGTDARVAAELALPCTPPWTRVSAPLRPGGREWGQLVASVPADRAREARAALERFAGIASMAAADADARNGFGDPTRDPLTGLCGHRGFFDRLEEMVGAARAARRPLSLVVVDIDHLKRINDQHGHTAGDEVVREIARRVAGVAGDGELVARIGGEEFAWVLDGADEAAAMSAARRLRRAVAETSIGAAGNVTASLGVAQLGRGEPGADSPRDLHRQAELALHWSKMSGRNRCSSYTFEIAEEVFARRAAMPAEGPSLRAMKVLAWAVDARDPHTLLHSERVANLAVQIAEALGWSTERKAQLREAGFVHDVGKVKVPDAILTKPGKLTDEEFAIMKGHAAAGAEIVADVLSVEQAAWVRSHHERWDGGGYPDGLAGDQIPEESRVLTVADAWDVIVSARSYKDASGFDEALEEMRRCSGTHFWPPAVAALERLVEVGALLEPEASQPAAELATGLAA